MDADAGSGSQSTRAPADCLGFGAPTARFFACAFAFYAGPAVIVFATVVPPLQNPDEASHVCRVDQVASGIVVGRRFDAAALVAVGLAAATCCLNGCNPLPLAARAGLLGLLLAACASIYAAEYLTYTPVRASTIDGVQGRYFIALALLLPATLPAPGRVGSRALVLPHACLLAFPAVSTAMAVRRVVLHFYV